MLDFNGFFRTQKKLFAIDVRAESNAIFAEFAQAGQTHYLKAAGIGQYGLVPIHKLVQTAHFFNQISPRTQHQMVRIAKQNLCAGSGNGFRHHRLNGGTGANRHKCRRIDDTMLGVQFAETGLSRTFQYFKFKSHKISMQ